MSDRWIDTILALPDTERVESANHVYTAAWDLFLRGFNGREENGVKKLATLAAILDLSLHLPPGNDRREDQWTVRSTPSYRFAAIVDALADVPFVDPERLGDYERFVEALCATLGWPSHLKELDVWVDRLAQARAAFSDQLDAFLCRDATALETEVARRVEQFTAIRRDHFGRIDEAIADERADFERALRGSPIACLDILGLGLVDYLERAMRLRIEDPWAVILPHRNPEKTLERLPLPKWWWGDSVRGTWDSRTLALLQDLEHMRHLYAVAVQWEQRRDTGEIGSLQCGFRLFDLPCPDPLCNGACPDWRPGVTPPTQQNDFMDTLGAYGLITS